jgi:hypothetical protein
MALKHGFGVAVVLWVLVAGATVVVAEKPVGDFFVATNGNDGWSGTLSVPNAEGTDGPFATLGRARDAVRAAKGGEAKAYTVLVRGGVYRLAEPIVFGPEDSGTLAGPITYAAWPGETPVFSGGRAIEGWTRAADGTWTATVPEVAAGTWYFHQLFVNGERRTRARTPNEGYYHIAGFLPGIENPHKERDKPETRLGFRYKPGDMKRWEGLSDVNVFVYHSWTSSLHWIKEVDEAEHVVRFAGPSGWPIGYWDAHARYTVENARAFVDAPGEWYLDRASGVLTYQPMAGEALGTAAFVAPRLRKLVVFDGKPAEGKFVEHIRLAGLGFEHATWETDRDKVADGQAAAWLEAAVFGRGARHCELTGCTIAHGGEYGLYLEKGCQDNRVVKCHIYDLGAGGVRLGHMSSPANENEAAVRNLVENCFIHDGGHVFPAGVGVWIGRSSYNTIAHNEICDFLYTGISVGWSWGYAESSANHNRIEYNHVYNIGQGVLSDMGGIYTLGVSPGTIIQNNRFHHIYSYSYGGWGLYTDEGSSEIVMQNNIVHDTKTGGFHQHYGRDNVVRNNVLAFSREGQIQRSREEDHNSFFFERNIVYFDSGQLLSSTWKNGHWRMDGNLYWDTRGGAITFAGRDLAAWQAAGFDRHSVIADPRFVDAGARDFRLRADSPGLGMGINPIDPERIGLYGEAAWVGLPKTLRGTACYEPPAAADRKR